MSDIDNLATELRVLLDELRAIGRMSRIAEPRDPDYWPHTEVARGLLAVMRRRDEKAEAVRVVRTVARLLSDAQQALAHVGMEEIRVRADERSRVLAAVADDIRGLTRVGDEAYEALAAQYSMGWLPGDEP